MWESTLHLLEQDGSNFCSLFFLLQLVINLLKILCTNAAWQRRKLGKILQDWRVIYVQVCPMSLDLNAKYFC